MGPKQKAADKKEQAEERANQKALIENEKREAAEWSVGAKDNSKAKASEDKEAEKLRKAAEKLALNAADEESTADVKKVAKTKKKGKDDFDMLNATLAKMPKTKAMKEAEAKAIVDAERKKKDADAREAKEARLKAERDVIAKLAARGICMNHTDDLFIPINNRLEEDDYEDARGLDAAVGLLDSSGGKVDEHPERRQKAAYNAYYESALIMMREDHPGLKLSQYKERIFDEWKTSPENPKNQNIGKRSSLDADS